MMYFIFVVIDISPILDVHMFYWKLKVYHHERICYTAMIHSYESGFEKFLKNCTLPLMQNFFPVIILPCFASMIFSHNNFYFDLCQFVVDLSDRPLFLTHLHFMYLGGFSGYYFQ